MPINFGLRRLWMRSSAWPVARRLKFITRAENLLDEEVVAGIGSDGAVERTTPRTLWIGLRFSRP